MAPRRQPFRLPDVDLGVPPATWESAYVPCQSLALLAVYACGCRLAVHLEATPETECHLCPRRGPLLGLLARAA